MPVRLLLAWWGFRCLLAGRGLRPREVGGRTAGREGPQNVSRRSGFARRSPGSEMICINETGRMLDICRSGTTTRRNAVEMSLQAAAVDQARGAGTVPRACSGQYARL